MQYPALVVDREKLYENISMMLQLLRDSDLSACFVTKVYCAFPEIVEILYEAGVRSFADSRVQNLRKIQFPDVEKWLLRLPMISECTEVARYADVSLHSEIATIKVLSEAALQLGKRHKVLMMVDVGDLREGVLPEDALSLAGEILTLKGITLIGIGTNLNCFGGIIPDETNLRNLSILATTIEKTYGINLPIISGGNSGSIYLAMENRLPKRVNHLRLGEGPLLGRETSYQNRIGNLHEDVFTLKAEIIELKEKPSVPIGMSGLTAFGEKPIFEDKGMMKRAILACGKQDIGNGTVLTPWDTGIEVIGSSSDHLILDVTHTKTNYQIGDVIDFNLDYGALLAASTSEYVSKHILT